jgi:hypothetical protein
MVSRDIGRPSAGNGCGAWRVPGVRHGESPNSNHLHASAVPFAAFFFLSIEKKFSCFFHNLPNEEARQ